MVEVWVLGRSRGKFGLCEGEVAHDGAGFCFASSRDGRGGGDFDFCYTRLERAAVLEEVSDVCGFVGGVARAEGGFGGSFAAAEGRGPGEGGHVGAHAGFEFALLKGGWSVWWEG